MEIIDYLLKNWDVITLIITNILALLAKSPIKKFRG